MIYDDLTLSKLPEEPFTEVLNDINENPTDYIKAHIEILKIMDLGKEVIDKLPEFILPKPVFSFILLYHFEAKGVLSAMKENKGLFKIGASEMESIKSNLNNIIVKANPILQNQVRNIKNLRNEEFLHYIFMDYESNEDINKVEEGLKGL